MTETPPQTEANGDLSQRVDALEHQLQRMSERAAVPAADVIFRPPLWSQDLAYSAADDRRLITSTLLPGVIDATDLRVQPRLEGANLSVDVLPGHIAIRGSDQYDQGTYVCPLAQRRNIPIAAGPSAGQHRRSYILARVFDSGINPRWDLVAMNGPAGPTSTTAPFPSSAAWPPSSAILAEISPITTSTLQITDPLIFDYRHRARPASTGAMLLRSLDLPNTSDDGWWGDIIFHNGPYWEPVDWEVRVEGIYESRFNAPSEYYVRVETWIEAFAGSSSFRDWEFRNVYVSSWNPGDYRPFSRTVVLHAVELAFPEVLVARATIAPVGGRWMGIFSDSQLVVRATASGTGFSW